MCSLSEGSARPALKIMREFRMSNKISLARIFHTSQQNTRIKLHAAGNYLGSRTERQINNNASNIACELIVRQFMHSLRERRRREREIEKKDTCAPQKYIISMERNILIVHFYIACPYGNRNAFGIFLQSKKNPRENTLQN